MKRLILLLSLVALGACGDFSTTIRPTAVTLTPDRTSAPISQNFRINYEAQGRSLNRLIIDYGDGAQDSLGFSGAVTATGFRDHAYEFPGTFIVTGTLEELQGTAVESTVTLNVTGTP
jgi:hypothetical protein